MATFGRYETVEELASSGPYSVQSAKVAGQPSPAFAVKMLRTQDMLLDEAVLERRAAEFLDAAGVQKQLAGQPNWAPIHEAGRADGFVYYVTDLYAGSAQALIDAKRDLKAVELVGLLRGVLRGLAAIREKVGARGHGRLKATNVLIAGRDEVAERDIALTDPAPAALLPRDPATADLRAVGALLFEVVMHRPAPRGGGDVAGPEWRTLKGAAEPLRHFCEGLINLREGGQAPAIDDLLAQLDKVPTREGWSTGKKVAVASVIAIALIGGGVGAYIAMSSSGVVEMADPRGPNWLVQPVTEIEASVEQAEKEWGIIPAAEADVKRLRETFDAFKDEADTVRGLGWRVTQDTPDGPQREMTDEDRKKLVDRVKLVEVRVPAITKDIADTVAKLRQTITLDTDQRGENWTPRNFIGLEKQVTDIRPVLESESSTESAASQKEVDRLFNELKGKIDALRAQPWRADTREGILREMRTLADEVPRVQNAVRVQRNKSDERLQAFIKKERDSLDAGEVKAPASLLGAYREVLSAVDPAAGAPYDWVKVRAQVQSGRRWLTEVAADLPAALTFTPGPESKVDPTGARTTLASQVEAAVERLAGDVRTRREVPSPDNAEYAKLRADIKKELQTWIDQADKAFSDAAAIESRLAEAYGTAEPGPGGASIKDLVAAVQGSPRYADVQAGVQSPLSRAAALSAIETTARGEELLAALKPDAEPGVAIIAWKRLPEFGYPRTLEELRGAPQFYSTAVQPRLASLPKARRDLLEPPAAAQLKAMWLGFVNERAGPEASNVEGAFALAEAFSMAGADFDALAPHAKFNRERMKLAADAKKISNPDLPTEFAAVRSRVATFWSDAASLGVPEAASGALRGEMAPFFKDKWINLEEEGPGKPGGAASWTAEVRNDGAEVVYRWAGAPSGRSYSILFRRVGEGLTGSSSASFVATTEVPVGLVIDLVEKAGKWEVFSGKELMKFPANAGDIMRNTWAGPRSWRWTAEGRLEINPGAPSADGDSTGNGWLMPDSSGNMGTVKPVYPPNQPRPGAPDAASPMTYIPPEAAIYVARLMNCRVPTSAEHVAAAGQPSAVPPNRRDAAWVAMQNHVIDIQPAVQNKAQWPGAGIFTPGTAPSPAADSDPAVPDNDGILWFRSVSPDLGSEVRSFADVVGNVAEYVFEKPELIEAATPETMATRDNAVRAGGRRTDLRVIGASALSPPSIDPATAQQITQGRMRLDTGFSDVGFRLAFTTGAGGGAGTPARRLELILSRAPYLTGK